MPSTRLKASASLVLIGAVTALASPPTAGAAAPEASNAFDQATGENVLIEHFGYRRQFLVVRAGERVSWTNNGTVTHTATQKDDAGFDSGRLEPGDSASFKFDTPGVYSYVCSIHPKMKGLIRVLAADEVGGTIGPEVPDVPDSSDRVTPTTTTTTSTEPSTTDYNYPSAGPGTASLGGELLPFTGEDTTVLVGLAAIVLAAGLLAGAAQRWWEWR